MKSNAFWCLSALVAMLFACNGSLQAQDWSQEDACPGWNNPLSFTDGGGDFFYSGRAGKKRSSSQCNTYAPNPLTGEVGFHDGSNGPFDNAPIIPANQLATYVIAGGSDHAGFPTGHPQNYGFAIYDTNTQVTGHPRNRDPNTGDQLYYVPTNFNTYDTTPGVVNTRLTKSIRIGDAYGYTNATALYYQMRVNGDNAMLYIYYACVIESPASGSSTQVHGKNCDPAFIIRVMKKNAAGQWIQANPNNPNTNVLNDSLTYMVSSTPAEGQGWTHQSSYGGYGTVLLNQTGQGTWHIYTGGSSQAGGGASYGSYKIMWKDWDKVALNLSPLYGEEVRIEVMVSDCCMTQHFAYGYLCGECRPMDIPSTGCPAGRSTNVTTLNAPRGLRSYVWEASEFGVSNPPLAVLTTNSHYTWRRVSAVGADSTEAANAQSYNVQASDFRVTKYKDNNGNIRDTNYMGNQQTFRCKMMSALDPAKPFKSYMYANVTNTKPSMQIDSLLLCGGDVKLWNQSAVPGGDPSMVDMASTSWKFYDTPNPTSLSTPLLTMTGDSTEVHFDGNDPRYVLVRTNTVVDPGAPECYSEAVYPIIPKMNPKAGMTITPASRILCDDGEATIYDTTENGNVFYRRWSFRPNNAPEDDDSTMEVYSSHDQSVTRSFNHAVEPIELYVRNGLYSVSRTNSLDTTWCSDTAHDTVRVFTHPELEVTGDTIVCRGSTTNATVDAVGVAGCTYQWSTTNGENNNNNVTGNLPAGPTLQVEPTSSVETYYVRVTSPQECVAWDSIRVYLVQPTMTMIPANGLICPGDTVTLIGGNADHYTWSASPADPSLVGQDSLDFVTVTPMENTVYAMVGHGSNDCNADSLFKSVTVKPLPIPQVSFEPAIVDVDDPTVMLRNLSEYSVGADWEFANGETASGNEVTHTFIEATGSDTVYVTLSPYNELNCPVHYRFGIPVALYNAWFPNVFTPNSEDENATFRMYANMPYEVFHLYIYNRRGEVVYESNSPEFTWDGTCNGVKCPQGAYVYICRYRKPGMLTLVEQRGTVTLVR